MSDPEPEIDLTDAVADAEADVATPEPKIELAVDAVIPEYYISISGGTSGGYEGEQLLSTSPDGKNVDLYSHDDDSGRQKWKIVKIPETEDLYYISISGGTSEGYEGEQLLSTSPDGKKVDLYSHDDDSGRQKWKIVKIPETKDLYQVSISGGTSDGFEGEQILSTSPDGKKVDLYSHDDDSGRQKWKIVETSATNRLYHVYISGGTSDGYEGEQILSTSPDGKKVDIYSHDDDSGRQKWKIVKIPETEDLYYISISGGTSGGYEGEQLLSTSPDGKNVDLYSHDDDSGRQKWKIVKIPETKDLYQVSISGGTSDGFEGEQLLSTSPDGKKVDLYSHDDDSGRQKWKIPGLDLNLPMCAK